MGLRIDQIGAEWLAGQVQAMDDHIVHVGPVEYNEQTRYLPSGTTPRPGFIRYDLFPWFREPLECFDPMSPVREVNFRKGVQTGFTVGLLEAILLYYIGHVQTVPAMLFTADKELADARMENNILPMINESGLADRIRSADAGNSRKTGKTKDYLQWEGGGFLMYNGAKNAVKMRSHSVQLILKDELDGWVRAIGQDGNSDTLTDARASAYWDQRKILRGSTPLLEPSMIDEAYQRGDRRHYLVRCKACGFPQMLKHRKPNEETGIVGGFRWELENGMLIAESVRYCCVECGEAHYEHDKERLFSEEQGAHWKPTAVPAEAHIRSYYLPRFYSPYGFTPWAKCIADFLAAFDPETKEVKSIDKYQEYYNNTLGKPFRVQGSQVRFRSVSAHRRPVYRLGQVPNTYAEKFSGSKIQFLTCEVDVQMRDLAVAVFGWSVGARPYLIDYWRFERDGEHDDCFRIESPVWGRLRELIEEAVYEADDGSRYKIVRTMIDANGPSNSAVVTFCSDYASGVYPILGRDRPAKHQRITEFGEFTTQAGQTGFRVTVDHYKDRMAPVLRRQWDEEQGMQPEFHFNAPVDTTDKQLAELTVEKRMEKVDDKGNTVYFWHRPGNARNELWDLLGYGYATVDILAWQICLQHFELERVDWAEFWAFVQDKKNDSVFCRLA